MMNQIFEFIGIYLMIGAISYAMFFIAGFVYIFIKLYPSDNKVREFAQRAVDQAGQKHKNGFIISLLAVVFAWPAIIVTSTCTLYSTIKDIA